MKKIYLFFLLICLREITVAQTQLSGRMIYSAKKEALVGVSVSAHTVKDSTLIKADVSDSEGVFNFIIPTQEEVLLFFNLVGMEPLWKKVGAIESQKIGEVAMTSSVSGTEIIIKSSVP
ncbi:MAG: hypothetical protein ACKO8Q_03385, partial [Bacteroidota bacterium]